MIVMVPADADSSSLSDEERAQLRSRVSAESDGVVLMREVAVATPQTIHVMWQRVRELAADWDSFVVLADLRAASRPGSAVRHALSQEIFTVRDKLLMLVAFTDGNMALRAAARFVLGRSGVPAHVVSTESEALEKARAVL